MHVHRVPVTSSFLHRKQPNKDVEEKRCRRGDREERNDTTEKQIEHIEISVAKEEKNN